MGQASGPTGVTGDHKIACVDSSERRAGDRKGWGAHIGYGDHRLGRRLREGLRARTRRPRSPAPSIHLTLDKSLPLAPLLGALPAISTWPLGNGAAIAPSRAVCSPVLPDAGNAVNVSVTGLNNPALAAPVLRRLNLRRSGPRRRPATTRKTRSPLELADSPTLAALQTSRSRGRTTPRRSCRGYPPGDSDLTSPSGRATPQSGHRSARGPQLARSPARSGSAVNVSLVGSNSSAVCTKSLPLLSWAAGDQHRPVGQRRRDGPGEVCSSVSPEAASAECSSRSVILGALIGRQRSMYLPQSTPPSTRPAPVVRCRAQESMVTVGWY